MLLDPDSGWALAQRIDDVLPALSEAVGERVAGETHGSAVELSTEPHDTVEVRVMDAQTRPRATRALVALLQSIAHLELEEGYLTDERIGSPEMLAENRFLAPRDGVHARLIDPVDERRVPVETLVGDLMQALAPHADALGCRDALETVPGLVRESGSDEQLRMFAEGHSLPRLVEHLSADFCAPATATR